METKSIVSSVICSLLVSSCAYPSESKKVTCNGSEYQIQGKQENERAMNDSTFHSAKGETFPSKIPWKINNAKSILISDEVFDLSFDESVNKWKILKGQDSFGNLVFLNKSVQGEALSTGQCLKSGLRFEINREGILENGEWFALQL